MKVIVLGHGISEDRCQPLGKSFYSNNEKGFGLGLMLTYKVIEHHHGKVTIERKLALVPKSLYHWRFPVNIHLEKAFTKVSAFLFVIFFNKLFFFFITENSRSLADSPSLHSPNRIVIFIYLCEIIFHPSIKNT